jgi:uncharacterized protein
MSSRHSLAWMPGTLANGRSCPRMALTFHGLEPIFQRVATVVSGDFEWDDAKAAANVAKHGITFDEAALALASDPNEMAFADPVEPAHVQSLVMSLRERVLFVVTTERGSRTRIISARKATDHEQRTYEAG